MYKVRDKELTNVPPQEHHVQNKICVTRAPYRQGKEYKAVKVYTINDESRHLLIHNVPSIGLLEEIKRLTGRHGATQKVEMLPDYPNRAEFTHVFYVKFKLLKDARLAKKKLDNRSFFGNLLHVCYAPELETVNECRQKLKERVFLVQKSMRSKTAKEAHSTPETGQSSSSSGRWANLIPSSSSKVVPRNYQVSTSTTNTNEII